MKLLNFFKKNRASIEISQEKCQKAQQRGQELTNLMHPQIEELLSKYYQNEIKSIFFQEKKTNSKDIFEIACVGLSVVNLIDLVEENDGNAELVKKCLKLYQEVYSKINKGHIFHQIMQYFQDYKHFLDSESSVKIKDKDSITSCFTGAWIIRYYIGEEATLQFESSFEIGKIIQDTIKDLWIINPK